MNYAAAYNVIGTLLLIESGFMLPPLIYARVHGEGSFFGFLMTAALLAVLGLLLRAIPKRRERIRGKDGLFIVVCGWVLASIFGAIPLVLGGATPNYIDALFETVSGFTTTGASVIADIESVDKSLVLWRSMTHWIGGMGILVFTLALLPRAGNNGFRIFKAETPGPVAGKVEPRMRDTALALYKIYISITLLLFVLLWALGMNAFDAVIHTLGVVGTGGFSSHANSIGNYDLNSPIIFVMGIFMLVCGTNFSLYSRAMHGKVRDIFHDEEYRFYLKIVAIAVVCITANLVIDRGMRPFYGFRDAFFQVSSIISTSGFASVDFDLWPGFSKSILLTLFFFGSCAGSTAGGIKMIRILVLWKIMKREIFKSVHPEAVMPIRINGKVLEDRIVTGIVAFVCVYFVLLVAGTALVSLSGVDYETALSGTLTCLSNVGPGFRLLGPSNTFVAFGPQYKLLFACLMLLGRLEFFTVLALIAPDRGRHFRE